MTHTYLPFLRLTSAVLLSALMFACGGDNKQKAPPLTPAEAFVAGTYPRFDPVIADVPFNTDLVFAKAAASDGTADVGAPSDTVRATVNGLDGFSTSAFFDVMVAGSVDAASVKAMQTVFLLELNTGGKDALNPANIVGFATPQTAAYDVRVVSLDGGSNNAIRIRPLQPLKAKTKYLVVLTNDIKDTAGKPLTRSWSYNALRDTTSATLESLVPVRTAIVGWETLAAGFLTAVNPALTAATAKEKLVLTYTFTTTDPQTTLVAMAAPRAAIAASQMAAGVSAGVAIKAATDLETAGLLSTPKQRALKVSAQTGVDMGTLSNGALVGNVGKLYTGFIKLPYYQTAPGSLAFGEFLKRNWTPDLNLAAAMKVVLPKDVDNTSYNLTYRYPFAAKTSDETVPLQVTLPLNTWVPSTSSSLNCAQISAASGGYPVVIYVHGITSDRTSGLALAHTLASQCIATVAIDLPLHGVAANNVFVNALNVEQNPAFAALYGADAPHERHFNIAGAGGAPAPMNFAAPTASDGSGAHFTNLGYLLNTRDNNRQAVLDLLNLNASLKGLDTDFVQAQGVKLNLNKVNVVGHSLGGILGTVFTSVNQVAIANEAKLGLTANLNPVRSFVASVAGTQVAQVLVNSATFAPVINAGLAKAGVQAGTSNYEKFMYAAQSAMDSGDAVSFVQLLPSLKIPVLLQQVKNDAVIPNSADSAPLAGTLAMARLLGATQLGLGQTQLGYDAESGVVTSGIVKLNAGDHGSLLRPTDTSNAAVKITAEMQAQVASFVALAGKVAVGSQAAANIETPAP